MNVFGGLLRNLAIAYFRFRTGAIIHYCRQHCYVAGGAITRAMTLHVSMKRYSWLKCLGGIRIISRELTSLEEDVGLGSQTAGLTSSREVPSGGIACWPSPGFLRTCSSTGSLAAQSAQETTQSISHKFVAINSLKITFLTYQRHTNKHCVVLTKAR